MPKNFYNLPSPWNPGYAIPENVMSEGLQRHAYTTKWAPRGTYDNTTDGSAGYAIPQYVKAEGTGRGTFTTAWLPRGYYGPAIPHYQNRHPLRPDNITAQALSGTDPVAAQRGNAALSKYGQRTARVIMNKLARTPVNRRDAMLRTIANHIDPTLYDRTQQEAQKAVAKGVPVNQSLEYGLANAMATGFVGELTQIGRTRQVPKRNSLLGMGMFEELGDSKATIAPRTVVSTGTGPGYISRSALPYAPKSGTAVEVGPFRFPVGNRPFVLMDTKEQFNALDNTFARNIRKVVTMSSREMEAIQATNVAAGRGPLANVAVSILKAMQVVPAPTNVIWNDWLKIAPGENVTLRAISPPMTTGNWSDEDDNRAMPLVQFTHPESGNKWGIFLALTGPSKTNPTGAQLYVKWLPEKPWYEKALEWIGNLPANLVELVGDVAKAIGGAACDFLQTPGAAAGAAAAASNPAAAAGVVVASGLCGPGAPPVVPISTGPSLITTLAIGGGALLAIHLITKKKKTTP